MLKTTDSSAIYAKDFFEKTYQQLFLLLWRLQSFHSIKIPHITLYSQMIDHMLLISKVKVPFATELKYQLKLLAKSLFHYFTTACDDGKHI